MNSEHSLNTGDILEDRYGNKMVIVDVLAPENTGADCLECFVLVNGRIKRVNANSPSIIKSYKKEKRSLKNG
jgi:hypothetical protein